MACRTALLALTLALGAASPSFAQRVPFEQTFTVPQDARLEVTTDRGRIDVSVGEPGRIVVNGDATVRVGWKVPPDGPDARERLDPDYRRVLSPGGRGERPCSD